MDSCSSAKYRCELLAEMSFTTRPDYPALSSVKMSKAVDMGTRATQENSSIAECGRQGEGRREKAKLIFVSHAVTA